MDTDTGRGWTDSPTTELRWRVMRAMVEPNRARDFALTTTLAESLGAEGAQIGEAFDHLAGEGLAVTAERRLAPGYTTAAKLTAGGLTTVERWTAATRSTAMRACSSALLWWLDSLPENERAATDQFLSDVRGSYFGEPFSNSLVSDVARELLSLGLIKATGAMGDSLLLAELTPTGRLVLRRFGGDLEAWQAGSTSRGGTSISVYGSTGVNVANDSPQANQSAVVSGQASEQLATFASALEQMVPALSLEPADEARAIGYVGQLRELTTGPATDPRQAGRLVGVVRDWLVGATSSAAGTALIALADQVSKLF